MSRTAAAPSANRLGWIIIFILITFAYVIQTELTQAVQRTYQKPYLLLFLTHSGYLVILPFHLLLLKLLQPEITLSQRYQQLKTLILLQFNHQQQHHVTPQDSTSDLEPLLSASHSPHEQRQECFPVGWFIKRSIQLTLFLALPAMCWYAAVPLADMTTITSIFNTNACFTYLFAVFYLDSERFELRKTLGVLGSFLGTLMISWGERSSSSPEDQLLLPPAQQKNPAQLRLLGIALALLGSIGYALYEVWYKGAIAWSDYYGTGPFASTLLVSSPYRRVSEGHRSSRDESDPERADSQFQTTSMGPFGSEPEEPEGTIIKAARQSDNTLRKEPLPSLYTQHSLLHANLMTSMVGLTTLCLLWIPIPFLHWSGIEPFQLVHDPTVSCMIIGIILTGVLFNAGFMILLGIWGPVVSSVGNLCTLVLIAVVDHTIIGALNSPDPNRTPPPLGFLSLLGCASILIAFSILNF